MKRWSRRTMLMAKVSVIPCLWALRIADQAPREPSPFVREDGLSFS